MNKFICLFLLLFFQSIVTADEILDQSISLAVECRTPAQVPDEKQEQKRQQILRNALMDSLHDYTDRRGIKASVSHFLQEQFGLAIPEERITNLKDTPMRGKSSDLVFFIKDEQDKLIYVVKAFNEPCRSGSHFVPELSAMTYIRQSHLKHIETADPLALGRCSYDGTLYALMAESAAAGKRLADYIYDVTDKPEGSEERRAALDILIKAMAKAGMAIGELQHSVPKIKGPFPQAKIEKMRTRLKAYMKTRAAKAFSSELPPEKLADYLTALMEEASRLDHYFVINHGDAHSRNMMYDTETDVLTMIDLGHMHEYIDASGLPHGPEGHDFMRLMEDVQFKSYGLLTAAELDEAHEAFKEGFISVTGELPLEKNQEFWGAYRHLSRLEKGSDYLDMLDSPQKEEHRMMFLYGIQQLAPMVFHTSSN